MSEDRQVPVPAWLRAKTDQLLARVRETLARHGMTPAVAFANVGIVMMPLTEPEEDATDEQKQRWEFTCDNCGVYCQPPFVKFNCGHLTQSLDGVQVVVMWGACVKCTEVGS